MPNPNFIPGVGGLATSRYDFEGHVEGTAFRHNSSQIDVNPSVSIDGYVYFTVADTLTAIASSLANLETESIAQGFITVGDGYDTYASANGDTNFDNTVPSLDTLLNPIFTAITQYQTTGDISSIPTGYSRIKDGGIVVIKAGTYIIANTVQIPPGFTLVGEGFGTKIVNATSLNLAATPPSVVSPGAPVFQALADSTRTIYYAPFGGADAAVAGAANVFMFARETRIWNMVICDNFVEPTTLNVPSTAPQNTTAALIRQDAGSSLFLYGVSLIGRVNFSSGQVVSAATAFALALNTSLPYPTGTMLKIDNCFIDGFSVPVQWLSNPGVSAPLNPDLLSITNSKIRGFGYLSGNSSSAIDNSIIVMNDNNANIANNYIYGNANNVLALVYMSAHITDTPNLQARAKIVVENNNIEVNRLSNATNNTFATIVPNYSVASYASILDVGNNFQDLLIFGVDGVSVIQSTSTQTTIPNLTVSNTMTLSGAETVSGSIALGSGAVLNAGSGSNINIQSGGNLNIDSGGNLTVESGAIATIDGAIEVAGTGVIEWTATATSPGLSQIPTGITNGMNMVLVAQSTDASAEPGGNLILNSGASGTGITTPSSTILQSFGNGGSLVVYPFQGTASGGGTGQRVINGIYTAIVPTTGSGSPGTINAFSITVPSISMAFVEICWVRRVPTTSVGFANKAGVWVECNSSGTVSTGTLTTYITSGGPFDAASSIQLSTSTNTLNIGVNNSTGTAGYWQIVININLN